MLRILKQFSYLSGSMNSSKITYINSEQAQQLDTELMSDEVGFSLDILMELAGQGIANTVHKLKGEYKIEKVIVLVGPGNNGGDGIVSARHLKMMGFDVDIVLLKETNNVFFKKLLNICTHNNINIRKDIADNDEDQIAQILSSYDLVIDSLLGFSYKPPLREPYKKTIQSLKQVKSKILSVDTPSGWHIEQGNLENLFTPDFLISLTLPKLGVKEFKGRHFLGGRFIPEKLKEKYNFIYPPYHGSETIQEITSL